MEKISLDALREILTLLLGAKTVGIGIRTEHVALRIGCHFQKPNAGSEPPALASRLD